MREAFEEDCPLHMPNTLLSVIEIELGFAKASVETILKRILTFKPHITQRPLINNNFKSVFMAFFKKYLPWFIQVQPINILLYMHCK